MLELKVTETVEPRQQLGSDLVRRVPELGLRAQSTETTSTEHRNKVSCAEAVDAGSLQTQSSLSPAGLMGGTGTTTWSSQRGSMLLKSS